MSYFLFIDESGHDLKNTPAEVLAGFAIQDVLLWDFVKAVHELERMHFGIRYSGPLRELKGRKFLKTKTFRLAAQEDPIEPADRASLAMGALSHGGSAVPRDQAALAQAKLAFIKDLWPLCGRFRGRIFAMVVDRDAKRPEERRILRKDYSYLFERFYYFLQDVRDKGTGVIVFDELEKSQSHILFEQMGAYFKDTRRGQERAKRILPEPFFVHSDLSTGVQMADLAAYILAWTHTGGTAGNDARDELMPFRRQVTGLAHDARRPTKENPRAVVRGIYRIADLRPWKEKS